MVPVKEAINSGAWLHFISNDESLQFRLKVLSFHKLNFTEVDNPESIQQKDSNSQWWLMGVESINLTKRNIHPLIFVGSLLLVDQDGFEFKVTRDTHLWLRSDFSKKSGLCRFFIDELIPKIKAVGTISFLLPDDDEVVYSLSMQNGMVQEA